MKPRFSEISPEVEDLMLKALRLSERIEKAKDKKCPKCDKLLSECGCDKKGYGKMGYMEKSQPDYTGHKEGSTVGPSHFMTETGGQVKTALYSTNQSTIDFDTVANKGATKEEINVDSIHMNPHDKTGVDRLVDGGSR